MMFLVDRLPAIYSASQQYGSPFASAEQAMAGLRELGATLFPSFVWAALAAIGVIGLAASSRHPIGRLFARIAVVIAITDCLYILYSARLPYPRVMFQFIPVVLIGIAWVLEDVVGRSIGARGKYLGGAVTIMTVAIVVAAQPAKDASADEQRELIERFASRDASGEVLTYPVFGRGVDAVAAAHQTPRRWLDVDARIPDGIPLRVAIFTRQAHAMSGIDFSAPPGVPSLWDHWRWTRPGARRTPPERNDNTASIHGRTYAWPNSGLTDERRMLFWYPDAERLGATAASATALVEASRLRYLAIATRRVVKLDLYSRLFVVIMLAETADQVRSADTAIHAAIEKFGGSAVIFVSDTQ
jgi:hypothetical protein